MAVEITGIHECATTFSLLWNHSPPQGPYGGAACCSPSHSLFPSALNCLARIPARYIFFSSIFFRLCFSIRFSIFQIPNYHFLPIDSIGNNHCNFKFSSINLSIRVYDRTEIGRNHYRMRIMLWSMYTNTEYETETKIDNSNSLKFEEWSDWISDRIRLTWVFLSLIEWSVWNLSLQ